jgi:amino acid adenylation domain-containing protein
VKPAVETTLESRLRQPIPRPPYPPIASSILHLCSESPHLVAIEKSKRRWTYGQLAERVDEFSRELSREGIGTGSVVAIHGRRCFAMVVAALGTLACGGVMFLIDPRLPQNRKRALLSESGSKLLVEAEEGSDPPLRITRLRRSGPAEAIAAPPGGDDAPAYLFFTSGTTGRPRGVAGTHAGLAHFIEWQRTEFGIAPGDRIAQLTNPSFDVILRELFLALASGATLCIPHDSLSVRSPRVASWIQKEEVTVVHTVPTLAESWLSGEDPVAASHRLRYAFFAGEPLTSALVERWRRLWGEDVQLVNLYGPTETTLAKLFFRVPARPAPGIQPLGRPLPYCQAWVLDGARRVVPAGESGEIGIRTPFRTLGYVNDPEAHARKFVVNPYRSDPDDLLYLTGDIGQMDPDGALQIRGRLDDQVKINGVRIEPSGIMSVLAQHPGVRTCAVMPVERPGDGGGKLLVAYWVRSSSVECDGASLKKHMLEQLPQAMVPSLFVELDDLPVTSNGKLDRAALSSARLTAEHLDSKV